MDRRQRERDGGKKKRKPNSLGYGSKELRLLSRKSKILSQASLLHVKMGMDENELKVQLLVLHFTLTCSVCDTHTHTQHSFHPMIVFSSTAWGRVTESQ